MKLKNTSLVALGLAAGISVSFLGENFLAEKIPAQAQAEPVPAAAALQLPTQTGVAAAAAPNAAGDPNLFVNLSRQMVPSVVNISTSAIPKRSQYGRPMPEDLLEHFFGGGRGGFGGRPRYRDAQPRPQTARPLSLGTGFVIDSSGLILTNNHVVDGADEIKVSFTESSDEKPTAATVVARDPELDVALIRVKTDRELTPAALGDSEITQVGEFVVAIGNPFGQGHSVTQGIISAKGRPLPELPISTYLQTDAPINPGNSGGPLVNLKGEVIGINTAIDARAQGIGFAIPINAVKKILPQLKDGKSAERGFLGVAAEPLTAELREKLEIPKGIDAPVVAQIYPGEPAHRAGVQAYDLILEFNGNKIRTPSDLVTRVTEAEVGSSVPMKVLRNGKEVRLQVKIGKRNAYASR